MLRDNKNREYKLDHIIDRVRRFRQPDREENETKVIFAKNLLH